MSSSIARQQSAQHSGAVGRENGARSGRDVPLGDGGPSRLGAVGLSFRLDRLGGVGVAAIAVLLVYEHSLVKPNDLARVNTAFFNVNAVVSMGLLIVGAVATVVLIPE